MKPKALKHHSNARHDQKLSILLAVCGAAGYGWYWMMLEMLATSKDKKLPLPDGPDAYAYASSLHTDINSVKDFVNLCIQTGVLESDEEFFWSPELTGLTWKKGAAKEEYPEDNTYYKMAVYFKGKIDEMAAAEGLNHLTDRTNLQVWADDFRKLVELDKQSDKDLIKSVMDWVVENSFWKKNILSAEKFRAKFPTLILEMKSKPKERNWGRDGYSSKPKVEIVKSEPEQPGVSEEEYTRLMEMAEQMKAAKAGRGHG